MVYKDISRREAYRQLCQTEKTLATSRKPMSREEAYQQSERMDKLRDAYRVKTRFLSDSQLRAELERVKKDGADWAFRLCRSVIASRAAAAARQRKRQKSEDVYGVSVNARITHAANEAILAICANAGMDKSQFLRQAIDNEIAEYERNDR